MILIRLGEASGRVPFLGPIVLRQNTLNQPDVSNSTVAEKAVYPVYDHGRQMLKLQRHWPACDDMDRPAVAFAFREGELLRACMFRKVRSDNRCPIRNDCRAGETAFPQGFFRQNTDKASGHAHSTATLFHGAVCFGFIAVLGPAFGLSRRVTLSIVKVMDMTAIDPINTFQAQLDPDLPESPAQRLLEWYDRARRRLPWRSDPGIRPDPYHVWLSEIMLQQTTVATVGPYFQRFLEKWPTVDALAAAPLDDVLHAWAGLGYYARARNLHKCAQRVADDLGSDFPDTEEGLLSLPGIGRYTAAAVAAIAFGRRAVVVDGNVERVMARLFSVSEPLPDSKPALTALADRCTPRLRAGDYAQAVMDIGATVCTPKKPKCTICPIVDLCAGRDIAESLPAKRPKPAKPTRRGVAFWIVRPDGAVLFRRRPESGLLGGMMEPPSSDWVTEGTVDPQPPIAVDASIPLGGIVRHTFTHFHLELTVHHCHAPESAAAPEGARWVLPDAFGDLALPTVMKKVLRHAMKGS